MPKTKGTKADTVKKVTVDDLLPVLENTDFKLDEQPYPSLFAIYQKVFRDISVFTGLIHSDALALAGNGMPVVTSHRERKKRICTCLLIHKVTYRYFLIFAVLQNMIHMDSCTLFSRRNLFFLIILFQKYFWILHMMPCLFINTVNEKVLLFLIYKCRVSVPNSQLGLNPLIV